MKKVISILLIALCVGCSPHNDDDIDSTQEENYMLIDLSKSDWLIGQWRTRKELEYDIFEDKYVWEYGGPTFTFNSDGTMRECTHFGSYTQGTYTYNNGTLVFSYPYWDEVRNKTFKFYKNSKNDIKLVVDDWWGNQNTYLIYRVKHTNNEQ